MLIHRLGLYVPTSVVVLSVVKIAGGAELPTELIDCRALTSSVATLASAISTSVTDSGISSTNAGTASAFEVDDANAKVASSCAAHNMGINRKMMLVAMLLLIMGRNITAAAVRSP